MLELIPGLDQYFDVPTEATHCRECFCSFDEEHSNDCGCDNEGHEDKSASTEEVNGK